MSGASVVVFITCASKEEAQTITHGLLEKKLAACVNMIDAVTSHFWWQGKIDSANEILLVVKTRKAALPKLMKLVKSLHSYTVPEIIALPIIAGEKKYLAWIGDSLR